MNEKPDSFLQMLWVQSFGSDELEHYTAVYTWLANQMAHAMMGFFIVACWALYVVQSKERYKLVVAQGGVIPWRLARFVNRFRVDVLMALPFLMLVVKELVDITSDRLKFRSSPIGPNVTNLLVDSVTDLLFWYAGMFLALTVASLFVDRRKIRLAVALLGAILCVGIGYVWLGAGWQSQKKTFDESGLPLNYTRLPKLLADWDRRAAETNTMHPLGTENNPNKPSKTAKIELIRKCRDVAASGTESGHFVLYRGRPVDKTDLAVSLGCEFALQVHHRLPWEPSPVAIELRKVIYTTLVQVLSDPDRLATRTDSQHLRCVVIDDVDVTIDPPLFLLAAVAQTKGLEGIVTHCDEQTQLWLKQILSDPTKVSDVMADVRQSMVVSKDGALPKASKEAMDKVAAKMRTGRPKGVASPADESPAENTATPAELDKQRKDDVQRLVVYEGMRQKLMAEGSRISTIWVLSNTGEKYDAQQPDADPQKAKREQWLYMIAYMTGQKRNEIDSKLIEIYRPESPKP